MSFEYFERNKVLNKWFADHAILLYRFFIGHFIENIAKIMSSAFIFVEDIKVAFNIVRLQIMRIVGRFVLWFYGFVVFKSGRVIVDQRLRWFCFGIKLFIWLE